jgi:hypothetical protein
MEGTAEVLDWVILHKSKEDTLKGRLLGLLQSQKEAIVSAIEREVTLELQDIPHLVPDDGPLKIVKNLERIIRDETLKTGTQGGNRALALALRKNRVVVRKDLLLGPGGNIVLEMSPEAIAAMEGVFDETFNEQYFRNINKVTRDRTREVISKGLIANHSASQIAGNLFTDPSGIFSGARAERIARTETTTALSAGQWAVEKELIESDFTSIMGREWLAIMDEDTRDAHRSTDGQQVRRRPGTASFEVVKNGEMLASGREFIVGGSRARFPGDPSLPPGQRINCRCTTVSVT